MEDMNELESNNFFEYLKNRNDLFLFFKEKNIGTDDAIYVMLDIIKMMCSSKAKLYALSTYLLDFDEHHK